MNLESALDKIQELDQTVTMLNKTVEMMDKTIVLMNTTQFDLTSELAISRAERISTEVIINHTHYITM